MFLSKHQITPSNVASHPTSYIQFSSWVGMLDLCTNGHTFE